MEALECSTARFAQFLRLLALADMRPEALASDAGRVVHRVQGEIGPDRAAGGGRLAGLETLGHACRRAGHRLPQACLKGDIVGPPGRQPEGAADQFAERLVDDGQGRGVGVEQQAIRSASR
jgi:hypothetical protein